jgi:hypothetical protein
MMCAPYMSNYYLCNFLLKLYIMKKLEKNDETDDDVYIHHFKRFVIRNYSELES